MVIVIVVVVVVATGAICADSGHYWGKSSIYVFSSVHGRAIGERIRSKSDENEEYWKLKEEEGAVVGLCEGCRDKEKAS